MAVLYELPSKIDNACWPMPSDYDRTMVFSPKDGHCQRCNKSLPSGRAKMCLECGRTRKAMRLELLQGWYDPEKPGQLMRSDRPEIFVAALNFFVDTYFRSSPLCRHQYYRKHDNNHRPTIQNMLTKARSALICFRGSGKTFAVVFEACPFVAITRPSTGIIVGSETKELTAEKLAEICRRVEWNKRIYADFGFVWPQKRTTAQKWSADRRLDFLNGSSIRGSSVGQATRGRHPLFGVVDDAEGEDEQGSSDARKDFMHWLLHTYLSQFDDHGSHVMLIGTRLHVEGDDSCLFKIVHNTVEDSLFANWERMHLKAIYEDPPGSGRLVSAWPEKLTVEDFEAKKFGSATSNVTAIGMSALMAEFQGEIVPVGDRMFPREERKHGYVMHENDHGETCIYDPATGKSRLLSELRAEAESLCGLDAADQTDDKSGCKSGITVALYDAEGIWWFVDAWSGRVFGDESVRWMYRLCEDWIVAKAGIEAHVLGRRVFRDAGMMRKERLDQRLHCPRIIGLGTDNVPKQLRIERMRTDWNAGKIKLPLFTSIDGYKSIKYPRRSCLQELIDQFDTITIETRKGSFDTLDSAEMLHRITDKKPDAYKQPNDLRKWVDEMEKLGIEMDPMLVPSAGWSKKMHRQYRERTDPHYAVNGACHGFC